MAAANVSFPNRCAACAGHPFATTCKRCGAASGDVAEPSAQCDRANNARAGDPRPGSGRPLQAERPVVREPLHEPDRRAEGDVVGRTAFEPRARSESPTRCESVESASRRARAVHSPRVSSSQIRCIHLIAPFEITNLSLLSSNYMVSHAMTWPTGAVYASYGLTLPDRWLPWDSGPIRPKRGKRRPMPDSDQGSRRFGSFPAGQQGPGPPSPLPGRAGGPIRIENGVRARVRPGTLDSALSARCHAPSAGPDAGAAPPASTANAR